LPQADRAARRGAPGSRPGCARSRLFRPRPFTGRALRWVDRRLPWAWL